MPGRHRRHEPPAPRRGRLFAIVGTVLAVVVLAVVVPLLLTGGGDGSTRTAAGRTDPPAQAASARSAATTPAPSGSAGAAPSAGATSTSPTPAATSPSPTRGGKQDKPPTLVVRADRGESWLTVTDARGRRLYDGMLRPGHRQVFTGRYFGVVVGNAGAVDITVDGAHRRRGGVGQVLTFAARG